jgi:uncharacterized YccA/Bax inhibitor family protein
MFQSSNPALTNEENFLELKRAYAGESDTVTVQGVVNKTGFLALLAVAAGGGGYMLSASFPSIVWITNIAAFLICIGVYFVIARNPAAAKVAAPIYAIVEGGFLGALTGLLDGILASMDKPAPGGVALQAFIITISVLIGMLLLYSFRVLRPTKMFVSIVTVATAGVMFTYLISFALSFFGIALPFISLGGAMTGGSAGLIGIGINVLILGLASMWLIIDFGMIEQRVAAGGPKSEEWFLSFALMVTLAWIYFEAVKLVFRIAASRD